MTSKRGMATDTQREKLAAIAAERHRRWAAYPALMDVLCGVLDAWEEELEDEDCAVNGAEVVEWLFADLIPEIRAVLKEVGETK